MENYFDKEVLGFYIDELSAHKYIGIVENKRKVGKTMLGVILFIHQMSRSGLDGVFFCSTYKNAVHIFENILHLLKLYGIKYDVGNKSTIIFDDFKIQFKPFDKIRFFKGFDKKVVLIDDISYHPRMHQFLNQIPYFAEYLVYTDMYVVDEFKHIRTYDTRATKTDIRLLKIKKLLNNE